MNIAALCLKQQEAKRRKKNKKRWDVGDEEKDKEEPRIKCREMMRACDRDRAAHCAMSTQPTMAGKEKKWRRQGARQESELL